MQIARVLADLSLLLRLIPQHCRGYQTYFLCCASLAKFAVQGRSTYKESSSLSRFFRDVESEGQTVYDMKDGYGYHTITEREW